MLKFEIGGVPVEIWFAPSFSIKTTDKTVEMFFRTTSMTTYDPIEKRMRLVRPSRSEYDAYLYLEELKMRCPEVKIKIKETPPLPTSVAEGTRDSPVLE